MPIDEADDATSYRVDPDYKDTGRSNGDKTRSAVSSAAKQVNRAGVAMTERAADRAASSADRILASMRKGGRVKKTGVYRLHKGERVLNKRQAGRTKKKGRAKSGRF
jgi:hypothetical protein